MKVISRLSHNNIILILFLVTLIPGRINSEIVIPDSTTLMAVDRSFVDERLERYRSKSEYAYYKGLDYEANLIQRIWRSIKDKIREALGLSSSARLNEILFYLFIIISIVGIIYHLLKSQSSGIWHRKSKAPLTHDLLLMDESVDINQVEKIISEAVATGNFRLAIRYHFYLAIKKLDTLGIIIWKPNMTNSALLANIEHKDIKEDFKTLISIFEHTWYGNYHVRESGHYHRYRIMYKDFMNKIGSLHV